MWNCPLRSVAALGTRGGKINIQIQSIDRIFIALHRLQILIKEYQGITKSTGIKIKRKRGKNT